MDDAARVVLTMPAQARFLRLARLAVADAATRAGFTVEEVEDLRLAIDELCGPMMVGDGEVMMTLVSSDGRVDVEGSGPDSESEAAFPEIAEAILDVVVDSHSVSVLDGTRTFSATKNGTPG